MKTRWNLALTARQARVCALLLSSASLLACATPIDKSASASMQPGPWQKHQYSFAYMGFTSTYSCDGLADKLKTLLLAAGARADAKSEPGACARDFGRPDKFARADLTFYSLAPPGGDATAGENPANGVWRSVEIAVRSPRELQIGDCELVEQFRNQVLPLFTTRNVVNHTSCVPYQESGTVIDLKFDSLVAAPPGGAPNAGAPEPAYPAAGGRQLFVYPKNGQSDEQQSIDKRECEKWASDQVAGSNGRDYQRAMAACLEGRGYSVN
jgi:hypothetical protein